MSMRKAFLTGGTGFLGVNVAKIATEEGWDVTALHRPTSDIQYLTRFPVKLAEGSITDKDSLRRAIPEGTDTIFHVAGDTSLWGPKNAAQYENNVTGTANIRDVAIEKGVRRLVVTSSTAAWGDVKGELIETRPKEGKDSKVNYYRTKHLAELEALKGMDQGLEVVVMNPAVIIGPFDTATWARVLIMAHTGKWLPVMPGTISATHGEEAARAHVAAADKGRPGENYILGGANHDWRESMELIFATANRPAPTLAPPAWLLMGAARVADGISRITGKEPPVTPDAIAIVSKPTFAHSKKAQEELGYKVVPLDKMVKDSYEWLKAEGLI